MPAIVQCDGLTKTYGHGATAETALVDVSIELEAGSSCVLLGPSGSGKTTLLSILGCLLTPTAGRLRIAGQAVAFDQLGALTELRRKSIGFVFQHAQLLPFLTVEANLRVVCQNAGLTSDESRDRITHLTTRLSIDGYLKRLPSDLSGGQRQRVAIARALLHKPPILLADEPTAALDWKNGQAAIQTLIEQAGAERSLLIVVTHDTRLVPLFDRVLHMDSGRLQSA